MDFITMAERLGIPTALLVIVGIAGYRLIVWLLNKILLPATQRHFDMIATQEQSLKELTAQSKRQTEELQAQTLILQKLSYEGCGHVPSPRLFDPDTESEETESAEKSLIVSTLVSPKPHGA